MRIFFKRVFRRFIHFLRFKEMWLWEYESCNRCGSCYRLPAGWIDSKWLAINGKEKGCLCIDCFLILAQEKNISINIRDIERMYVFDPSGESSGFFYIIKPIGKH